VGACVCWGGGSRHTSRLPPDTPHEMRDRHTLTDTRQATHTSGYAASSGSTCVSKSSAVAALCAAVGGRWRQAAARAHVARHSARSLARAQCSSSSSSSAAAMHPARGCLVTRPRPRARTCPRPPCPPGSCRAAARARPHSRRWAGTRGAAARPGSHAWRGHVCVHMHVCVCVCLCVCVWELCVCPLRRQVSAATTAPPPQKPLTRSCATPGWPRTSRRS
jgi:hypothetical protein